jgi:hypothetical protein
MYLEAFMPLYNIIILYTCRYVVLSGAEIQLAYVNIGWEDIQDKQTKCLANIIYSFII